MFPPASYRRNYLHRKLHIYHFWPWSLKCDCNLLANITHTQSSWGWCFSRIKYNILPYPTEALNTDVVCVRSTRSSIYDSIPQLIVRHRPGNTTEELTSVLHQNCDKHTCGLFLTMWRKTDDITRSPEMWIVVWRCTASEVKGHSLPLYLGTQRTDGGRPLMLKCFPSKCAHCSSLKSLWPRGHGSVLHERNFIRRPTQKRPPFLGLRMMTSAHTLKCSFHVWTVYHWTAREVRLHLWTLHRTLI